MMDTLPLDLNSLVSEELDKEDRKNTEVFPTGARIGHITLESQTLKDQSSSIMKN